MTIALLRHFLCRTGSCSYPILDHDPQGLDAEEMQRAAFSRAYALRHIRTEVEDARDGKCNEMGNTAAPSAE
ncbi:MAG: hypothetical protein L6R41_004205 [Letrouitia leprolyta]|nr:MAG: hypothetical protein L6R41_004205 [Letrouitia leprolyta]